MTQCQCTGPGHCPLHNRQMSEAFWKVCRDQPGGFAAFQKPTRGATREKVPHQTPRQSPPKKKRELGDLVHDALSKVGVTPEVVEGWLGKPCGCAERQQKLNALSRWAKSVASDIAAKVPW